VAADEKVDGAHGGTCIRERCVRACVPGKTGAWSRRVRRGARAGENHIGPLEPAFTTLTVTDATGKQVNTGKSTVDANQPAVASVPLPVLPAGHYTVHWAAVAQDGHRTHGDYAFNVK
jgi:hypothetical protein